MNSRTWKLAVGGTALVVAAYAGAAYWTGLKTEETLAEQHKMLAELPLFVVKSHTYQRGWFSSAETTELTFNQKLFKPYLGMLPGNSADWLNTTIKFTHHIKHGPLPEIGSFGFRPARAVVTTEFEMSEQTRKTLAKFFGDREPITLTNRLNFVGGGQLTVSVPKFDYEETLSGVKVAWQGLTTKIDYEQGYKQYAVDAKVPGFVLEAATKGHFELVGLNYLSENRPGSTGVKLGTSELSIDKIRVESKESLPYEIKLNELVHLLTRIRVGEFINPVGEIKPSKAELDKLRYQIVTTEQDEFVNSRGRLSFDRLAINQTPYGPLKLDVAANHLHGPTLIALDDALGKIPVEGVDPAAVRQQYLDTIKTRGLPLLTNNPKFLVNDFYLKIPSGEIRVNGNVALNDLHDSDLKKPTDFLGKVEAEARIDIPRQTLQDMVVAQARNLFMVDASAENPPSVDEIDDLAKNLLDSQLAMWIEQNYVKQEGSQIKTELRWQRGKMTVNTHPIKMPWQEPAEIVEPDPAGTEAPR